MVERMPLAVTIKRTLGRELRQYAIVAAYLYVCFGALILYKVAILSGQGISYAPYGLAAVKALILAKFMLLGHAVKMGDRYQRRRFIHVIAHKSLLFLVMLLVLSVIEEAIVGVAHGRTITASLADVAGNTLPQILATSLIMLLILIPYLTFKELGEVLGEGRLQQLLFAHRTGIRSDGARERGQG